MTGCTVGFLRARVCAVVVMTLLHSDSDSVVVLSVWALDIFENMYFMLRHPFLMSLAEQDYANDR